MIRFLTSAALAFALSACATVASAPTDRPTAGLGQTASVGPLSIRPLELLEDSRCPVEINCIWGGALIVRSEVTLDGHRDTRDLMLGKPQAFGNGQLVLSAAVPVKSAYTVLKPGDYRFTFDYTGGL